MIKAVIFDMDGVISDTESLQARFEQEILKRFGIELSIEEISSLYGGVPAKEMFTRIFTEKRIETDIVAIINEKWAKLLQHAKGNVNPIPGALELIQELHKKGYKLGVASSSSKRFIELVLKELNITNYFGAITGIEDVQKGKPAPDLFLLTANRLQVTPQECIVIEDSYNGMLAAKNARMKCIGLVKDKKIKKYPTDVLVERLEEIRIEKLKVS